EIYIREWMEEYCIECDKASHFFATPTGRDVYGISGIHDWNDPLHLWLKNPEEINVREGDSLGFVDKEGTMYVGTVSRDKERPGMLIVTIPHGYSCKCTIPEQTNALRFFGKVTNDGGIKAVIFDKDGVISDSIPLYFITWEKIFREINGRQIDFAFYIQHINGHQGKDTLRKWFPQLDDAGIDALNERRVAHYEALEETITPAVYIDTAHLILRLKAEGYKMAVASGADDAKSAILKTGLAGCFTSVIGGSQVRNAKPDPEIFLKAAGEMGVLPEETVIVGDSVSDMGAAVRGGFREAIGAVRFNNADALRKAGADRTFEDLSLLEFDGGLLLTVVTNSTPSQGVPFNLDPATLMVCGVVEFGVPTAIVLFALWHELRRARQEKDGGMMQEFMVTPGFMSLEEEVRDILARVADQLSKMKVSGKTDSVRKSAELLYPIFSDKNKIDDFIQRVSGNGTAGHEADILDIADAIGYLDELPGSEKAYLSFALMKLYRSFKGSRWSEAQKVTIRSLGRLGSDDQVTISFLGSRAAEESIPALIAMFKKGHIPANRFYDSLFKRLKGVEGHLYADDLGADLIFELKYERLEMHSIFSLVPAPRGTWHWHGGNYGDRLKLYYGILKKDSLSNPGDVLGELKSLEESDTDDSGARLEHNLTNEKRMVERIARWREIETQGLFDGYKDGGKAEFLPMTPENIERFKRDIWLTEILNNKSQCPIERFQNLSEGEPDALEVDPAFSEIILVDGRFAGYLVAHEERGEGKWMLSDTAAGDETVYTDRKNCIRDRRLDLLPSFQHRRLGAIILQRLQDKAYRAGYERVMLRTRFDPTLDGNKKLFYEKSGYGIVTDVYIKGYLSTVLSRYLTGTSSKLIEVREGLPFNETYEADVSSCSAAELIRNLENESPAIRLRSAERLMGMGDEGIRALAATWAKEPGKNSGKSSSWLLELIFDRPIARALAVLRNGMMPFTLEKFNEPELRKAIKKAMATPGKSFQALLPVSPSGYLSGERLELAFENTGRMLYVRAAYCFVNDRCDGEKVDIDHCNIGVELKDGGKNNKEDLIKEYFAGDAKAYETAMRGWIADFKRLRNEDKTEELILKNDEFLRVVDENDNYTGVIRPRDLCHVDGTLHRTIIMFMVDREGKILIQVRDEDKKFFPLCREAAATGHMGLERDYLIGAVKETQEEVFSDKLKLDHSRVIRVSEPGEVRISNPLIDPVSGLKLLDNERAAIFVYFASDEEKTRIKAQKGEVKRLEWVKLDDELARWQAWEKNGRAKFMRSAKDEEATDYAGLGMYVFPNPVLMEKLISVLSGFKTADKIKPAKEQEMFLVCDQTGNLIKDERGGFVSKPRDVCHKDGTWHRTAFVIFMNREGRIYTAVRSASVDKMPSARDASAATNCGMEPDYKKAALKAAEKKLFKKTASSSILPAPSRYVLKGLWLWSTTRSRIASAARSTST
ncbi:MAG: HAD-IA family hydrolase, partial [Deltaproteobacteria bacterium]